MRSVLVKGSVSVPSQVFLRLHAAHNSQALQELHQLIGGAVTKAVPFRGLQPTERALLHREVGFDLHMGRCRALVTQPQRDYGDVDARLEQVHSCGVANGMW